MQAHSLRTFGPLVATIAAFLAVAGCSAEAGTASSSTTAAGNVAETITSTEARTDVVAAPPHGGHPGPDSLVFAALHESIGLTADQEKTIQALASSSGPHHPFDPARAATLAAGIRAGQVFVTKTAPTEDEITAHRTAASNALATLHATLTAPQRRALVDAIAKREAERDSTGKAHEGPMGPGGHAGRGPMDHLLEGLSLTAAQQQEVTAKLEATRPAPPSDAERAAWKAQHESMHAAMRAKLETFAGDTFDATAFVTPPAGAPKPAGDHPDRFLADLAVVTPILDSAQREKLAQHIEAGPPARMTPTN